MNLKHKTQRTASRIRLVFTASPTHISTNSFISRTAPTTTLLLARSRTTKCRDKNRPACSLTYGGWLGQELRVALRLFERLELLLGVTELVQGYLKLVREVVHLLN